MVDFFIGIIVGSSLTYIFSCFKTQKNLSIEKDYLAAKFLQDLEKIETEASAVCKPDNKKVRYYTSPEYKREKAFVEEQKAKRRSKIEYD